MIEYGLVVNQEVTGAIFAGMEVDSKRTQFGIRPINHIGIYHIGSGSFVAPIFCHSESQYEIKVATSDKDFDGQNWRNFS